MRIFLIIVAFIATLLTGAYAGSRFERLNAQNLCLGYGGTMQDGVCRGVDV